MNNDSRPTFRFQNLGPIKDAELELGDLTIIAGRNNTGKTYVAYALYGFLKQWPIPYAISSLAQIAGPVFEFAKEAERSGHLKLPKDKELLQKRRTEIIGKIARSYSKYVLPDVFSADSEALENASVAVQLGDPPDINIGNFNRPHMSLKQEGDDLIMSFKNRYPLESEDIVDLVLSYLSDIFPEIFISQVILTCERFGISLFHRELDLARNEMVRALQQMGHNSGKKKSGSRSPYELIEKSSSRYARPIQDNINYTRDIPELTDQKSGLYEQKRHDDIKRMMQGYFRVESGGVRFVSTARKEKRFNLPLYRASSSARGLSDLYFYMRHVAKEGQLLMVDEPEAHLDTENQIEMARLLARLVRSGVKVLITTHSDYIAKEFNNLIMLGRDFRDKERVAKRYGYDEGECLDADQVRAYIAENNGLTLCDMNDYGIDYPNFDETINKVNRRSRAFSQSIWADREK